MHVFWRVLMEAFRNRGLELLCLVPQGDASAGLLEESGARVEFYPLDRKGINPLADWRTYRALKKIFARERPDLLFATTIKAVIYGCQAAKAAGVPNIFAAITGLGYAFETDSPMKKIIHGAARMLYRRALKNCALVFFQNRDDLALFRGEKIIPTSARALIEPGTGVDPERFAPAPLPSGAPKFLVVARLLEAKGLREYAEAAKALKARHPEASFRLLGPEEKGRGGVSPGEIEKLSGGAVEYLGEAADVRPFIAAASALVLPSWREGVPTSLMEGMSMGRPIVAADSPGCRETVAEGQNGFLCEARSPASLAAAMEKFIARPELIERMGAESRRMALDKFDAHKIADFVMGAMLDASHEGRG